MPAKNQVRIIAGKWRGRKISFPDTAGLRPTGDRNRETLFNWLQGDLAGSCVLDLFAGSGALGIEALSRGAQKATFVELDRRAGAILKQSLTELGAEENSHVYNMDARTFLRSLPVLERQQAYDVVFLDPPFGHGLIEVMLPLLLASNCLAADAIVYLEYERKLQLQLEPQWQSLREKKSGIIKFGVWKHQQ